MVRVPDAQSDLPGPNERGEAELHILNFKTTRSVLETQTKVDPYSIPLPLHVILKSGIHSQALHCSVAV